MDPTKRFSSRVDNYVKYRPGYPNEILDLLVDECGLTPTAVIADIGSGTGKLAELFLQNGNPVWGVEPNHEMRAAGERYLAGYEKFISVNGRAEAATLPRQHADFITAGQAFHWFSRSQTAPEFRRILKPDGWIVLVWNDRPANATPFMQGYERILDEHAIRYREVHHQRVSMEEIAAGLGLASWQTAVFSYRQQFDWDGLKGRLLSSSYAPEAGHPNHQPMLAALRQLFDQQQRDGQIQFDYTTRVYYGSF